MMELDSIVVGDCIDVMADMPDGCVDLVFADPPHNKGLADWDKDHDWHSWIPEVLRILKPNGALWIDHSVIEEAMAMSHFIVEIGGPERINLIVWDKFNVPLKDRWAFKGLWDSPLVRSWPQMAEYLIYHAEDGRRQSRHGFIFEPLRVYLDGERKRAGVSHRVVIKGLGMTGHDTHFFSRIQWKLPLKEQYETMREILCNHGDGNKYLQVEYEDLRAEYEDLRSTFNGPPGCNSVWPIPAWNHEADWHPTPKPEVLLKRIINITSNKSDLIFDPFMGSGTTEFLLGKKNDQENLRSFRGAFRTSHPSDTLWLNIC